MWNVKETLENEILYHDYETDEVIRQPIIRHNSKLKIRNPNYGIEKLKFFRSA